MKHGVKTRKFGREASQRKALIESLAEALILHEQITTTEAKAKELRPFIEKLVTRAGNPTLANRRLILAKLGNRSDAAKKLVEEIGPRYVERPGGYTRIVKLPQRQGDGSPMAIIQFV